MLHAKTNLNRTSKLPANYFDFILYAIFYISLVIALPQLIEIGSQSIKHVEIRYKQAVAHVYIAYLATNYIVLSEPSTARLYGQTATQTP